MSKQLVLLLNPGDQLVLVLVLFLFDRDESVHASTNRIVGGIRVEQVFHRMRSSEREVAGGRCPLGCEEVGYRSAV